MVIQSINGIYMHCAWGTSAQGADFSLVEFADATYRGIYYDRSPAESMDPITYKWILIDSIDGDATEDDAIEAENAAALANAQAEQANSQTIVNNDNLQASQYSTDDKTGNPNELVGTNQGTNGWTASAGLTISAVTDTIYNPTDDPVNYLHVVCDSAGSNYICFDATALRGKLSELTDDNAFTFSADLRMSTVFALSVAVQNVDGTDQQIDFGTIDTELIPVPEETADGLWTFNKLTTDMVGGVAESSQVLYIDLSNMGAGDTLDVANLKVEGGALATPWRASLDEVAAIANQAYQVAGNTQQHFWFTSTGADTGAHITEKTQDDFLQDPTNGGGNLLARSNGIALRDGLDEIGAFYTDTIGGDLYATLGFENDKVGKVACFYDDNDDETTLLVESKQKNGAAVGQLLVAAYQTGYLINIGSILYVRDSGYTDRIQATEDVRLDKDLYVDNDLYINNIKVVDYVIERGTSGNWKYIKWASGRVECEGYYTFASLSFSASGNMYRSVSNSFTIPSGIFTTAPTEGMAWIQGSNTVYPSATIGGLTTTGGNCQIWKSTSGNATNVSVHMRIVYR
jgi:hypothetical protein